MGPSRLSTWVAVLGTAIFVLGGSYGCKVTGKRCFSKRRLKHYCQRKCKEWTGGVLGDTERKPARGGVSGRKSNLDQYRGGRLERLIQDLKRSGWSSTIVFLDPRHGNDVWMRIAVKPATNACVSNDASKSITTVPIPPHSRLTACGKKDGPKRWFEHSRGVGVVEIHRGKGRGKPHFRISWRNMRGNVRVFSQTFVLPEEYEWEARDMRKVVNATGQTVDIQWKKWRHNILSMTVHQVQRIKGRLRYRLRKTPLEEELLKAYKDCPECVQRTEDGVMVRLPMQVLFASGKAKLAPKGKKLLDQFLPVLQRHVGLGRRISVVGHTDSVPIKRSSFASNWELSTARACAVVRHFLDKALPSRHFKAVGHAGNRPVASNKTAAGKAKNRRVELFFETKGALQAVGGATGAGGKPAGPRKG